MAGVHQDILSPRFFLCVFWSSQGVGPHSTSLRLASPSACRGMFNALTRLKKTEGWGMSFKGPSETTAFEVLKHAASRSEDTASAQKTTLRKNQQQKHTQPPAAPNEKTPARGSALCVPPSPPATRLPEVREVRQHLAEALELPTLGLRAPVPPGKSPKWCESGASTVDIPS